jgi:hypothetical protein
MDHLEGQRVKVVADGIVQADTTVSDGFITLTNPAKTVQSGLGFRHLIEPLPANYVGNIGGLGSKSRPISITFTLLNTGALRIETVTGSVDAPFRRFGKNVLDSKPLRWSGEITVRTFGWLAQSVRPLWRIEQDTPAPFALLSVVTEISANE